MSRCIPRRPALLPKSLLSLAIAVLVLGARPAGAQIDTSGPGDEEPPTVAVMPFGGSQPQIIEHLNQVCEKALRRIAGLKVLNAAQWSKEARESGQGDDLEAMARRLGADLLVTGTLSQVKGWWRLSVDVFNDKGLPISALVVDSLTPDLGATATFQLEEGLARIVRPAVGLQAQAPPTGPANPEDEPSPQDVDREKPVELAKVEGLRVAQVVKKPWVREPWRPLLDVKAGLLASGRRLSCAEADARRHNQPCAGPEFPLSGGAGLRLDATVFPLALRRTVAAPLAGLGIGFTLDLPFWANRQQQNGSSFPTKELRFEGGVRWHWNIGNATLRPILEAGLAYGFHSFALSGGAAQPPYPDVGYQYLLPQLGLGSFLTQKLHLHAGLSILGILTAGSITDATAQNSRNPFGPGSAWGFRVSGEAEYLPLPWLSISLGGKVERIAFSFDGTGCAMASTNMASCYRGPAPGMTTASPSLPVPIQSAEDLYLGLWLLVGYRF